MNKEKLERINPECPRCRLINIIFDSDKLPMCCQFCGTYLKRKKLTKLSQWIYFKLLPIYIPKRIVKYKLAIWCCIDVKDSGNLWKVLKGTRITIRKLGNAMFIIKRGQV